MNDRSQISHQPEALCLACGLCCNGVIFADVRLQTADSPDTLRRLGLPLKPIGPTNARSTDQTSAVLLKFPQPCPAFESSCCRIYPQRPQHCRAFECRLLQKLKGGFNTIQEAQSFIRAARQKADTVRDLLVQLGDQHQHLPLARRFRVMASKLERTGLDEHKAAIYSRLTLTVHELNLILSQAFY